MPKAPILLRPSIPVSSLGSEPQSVSHQSGPQRHIRRLHHPEGRQTPPPLGTSPHCGSEAQTLRQPQSLGPPHPQRCSSRALGQGENKEGSVSGPVCTLEKPSPVILAPTARPASYLGYLDLHHHIPYTRKLYIVNLDFWLLCTCLAE